MSSLMIVAGVGFFYVYSYLTFQAPGIFNSPDESMNALAVEQLARGFKLGITIPEYLREYQFIDPRATFLRGPEVVQSGFLGMPLLYGLIGRAVRQAHAGWYLTPLFAILGAWGLYFLTKTAFHTRIALFSFFVYLVTPAVWYYATRGMFHNVLFTVFIIWGLYFFMRGAQGTHSGFAHRVCVLLYCAAAGIILGLGLWVRPSEAVWLIVAIAAVWFVLRRSIKPWHAAVTLVIMGTLGALYFVAQRALLGAWLPGGYGVEAAANGQNFLKFLVPFGFHPSAIVFNVYHYYVRMFWWITLPALCGLALAVGRWKHENHTRKAFFWFTLITGLGLTVIIYGNWMTYDNPNPAVVSITNAHVRYWLPLFVLSVPWMVFCLDTLTHWFVRRAHIVVAVIAGAMIIFFSVLIVWQGQDGLSGVLASLKQGEHLQTVLEERAKHDDLILVDREDKFIFPQFWVSRRWDYDSIHRLLVEGHGVWYVNDNNQKRFIEEQAELAQYGLRLEEKYFRAPHVVYSVEQ